MCSAVHPHHDEDDVETARYVEDLEDKVPDQDSRRLFAGEGVAPEEINVARAENEGIESLCD